MSALATVMPFASTSCFARHASSVFKCIWQATRVVYSYPSVGKELASVLIMGSHHTRASHDAGVERALVIPHKHAYPHSLPSLLHQQVPCSCQLEWELMQSVADSGL